MKKGFTLVELLAVIAILGIIMVVVTPVVADLITSSKQKASEEQIKFIENAAMNWSTTHSNDIDTDPYYVSVDRLITDGFIDQDELVDPKTKQKMSGCVKIEYDSNYNNYDFKYGECN